MTTIDGLDTISSSGVSATNGATGSLGFREARPPKSQKPYGTAVASVQASWLCENVAPLQAFAESHQGTLQMSKTVDEAFKTLGAASAALLYDLETVLRVAPDAGLRDLGCLIAAAQLRRDHPEEIAQMVGSSLAARLPQSSLVEKNVMELLERGDAAVAVADFETMTRAYPDAPANPLRPCDVRELYVDFIRRESAKELKEYGASTSGSPRLQTLRANAAQRQALHYMRLYLVGLLRRAASGTYAIADAASSADAY
jgi:hypothetical protein